MSERDSVSTVISLTRLPLVAAGKDPLARDLTLKLADFILKRSASLALIRLMFGAHESIFPFSNDLIQLILHSIIPASPIPQLKPMLSSYLLSDFGQQQPRDQRRSA